MSAHPFALAALLVSFPAVAGASPLNLTGVFVNAAPLQKLIMLALIVGMATALVIGVLKSLSGSRLSGGSAFVSGLRFGGPIIGILGAAYAGLNMAVGIANVTPEPSLKVLAPGFAEVILMVGLGFAAGAVAVIAHWAIESRIDRQVLSA